MRLLLALAMVLLTAPAFAAPSGIVVRLRVDAWPPDTHLQIARDGWKDAGSCERPVLLTLPAADPLRVRFVAPDHLEEDRDLTLGEVEALPDGTSRYAEPIRLRAASAWIGARTWMRWHPAAGLGAVTLMALGAGLLARTRRGLQRAEALQRLRLEHPEALDIGASIGPYRTVARLGAGGMGQVYRAVPEETFPNGEPVALKVLTRAPQDLREARALARLQHPNIVKLLDWGEGFVVMELVDGVPLSNATLQPEAAKQAARDILAAMAYAHQRGVLHRDIKPSNVMWTRDGRIKVMDFGLAAVHEGTTVAGTPGYMAPELLRGEPATAASDQYALGLLLRELLGERFPPELARMTADDPADRFATVAEIVL